MSADHDDGFQSWSVDADGTPDGGEVKGITLRGNTFINYEDPNQPFRGTLQGIGCFDGMYVDFVIENNVIITDHWHGITLMGARNSRIVNNTVLDPNDQDPGPPWVRIAAHKNGTTSTDCVVRNSLTTSVNIEDGQDVEEDHNIIIDDPASHFVDVTNFDVHLIAGSCAVDNGSRDLAPARAEPRGALLPRRATRATKADVVVLPRAGGNPDWVGCQSSSRSAYPRG